MALRSSFLGMSHGISRHNVAAIKGGLVSGSRISAWFKFGKNGMDSSSAGIYGSQGRDDYDEDDVEQVGESLLICFATLLQFWIPFIVPVYNAECKSTNPLRDVHCITPTMQLWSFQN